MAVSMDFSLITPDLFIGCTPSVNDYPLLRRLGVRLLINMRWEHPLAPDPSPDPLKILWLRTIDHPFFPIPISALQHGAQAALEVIRSGGKVYAFCAHGRHRSVAMGAAILIAQGYDPLEAMRRIAERRPVADPFVFYIRGRILKFAQVWPRSGRG